MRRDDLLDLNDVLQHPGRKLAVDITTELDQEEEIDLVSPLEGTLETVSTGNLLLITGEFHTRTVVECARCGEPIEVDVAFEMQEQFDVEGVPSSFGTKDYARVTADEPSPLFDENHLLVEALVRQGLLVNLPIQPLCEFGWDGPCPRAKAAQKRANDSKGRPEFRRLSEIVQNEETPG